MSEQIRVATLCSGYDSQCLALERLKRDFPDFDYELMWWSDIDKFAIKAHDALFPQWADRNKGDMTKIEWEKCEPIDLLFYSTPCQSISQAGLQHGFTEGSGTRSSIIWNVRDAIRTLKPKFAVLENVSAMVSEKFRPMFNLWQLTLEQLGYRNYAQVLNAKDYGVPQYRERIFLVSVRNDVKLQYYFPFPFKLQKRLSDVLEDNVDERYYVSFDEYGFTVRIYTYDDRCIYELLYKGKVIKDGDAFYLNDSLDFFSGGLDISRTLKASKHDLVVFIKGRVRKITEREAFRLMGVDDKNIDIIQSAGIPKTQQYKLAGNSIVEDVLYHIFRKMFVDTKADAGTQLELF